MTSAFLRRTTLVLAILVYATSSFVAKAQIRRENPATDGTCGRNSPLYKGSANAIRDGQQLR